MTATIDIPISKKVYDDITDFFEKQVREVCLVLGGTMEGEITEVAPIKSMASDTTYLTADGDELSNIVNGQWCNHNICFLGFAHNHILGEAYLSKTDVATARNYLEMNQWMKAIYMLIFHHPSRTLYGYHVSLKEDGHVFFREIQWLLH